MDKYDIPSSAKKLVLEEQLAEHKKLIFRNYIEGKQGEASNQDNKVEEARFNIKTLKKQIDVLDDIMKEVIESEKEK